MQIFLNYTIVISDGSGFFQLCLPIDQLPLPRQNQADPDTSGWTWTDLDGTGQIQTDPDRSRQTWMDL